MHIVETTKTTRTLLLLGGAAILAIVFVTSFAWNPDKANVSSKVIIKEEEEEEQHYFKLLRGSSEDIKIENSKYQSTKRYNEKDTVLSFTKSDSSYAELPIGLIAAGNNKANTTISFWLKLLPDEDVGNKNNGSPIKKKRRVIWSTKPRGITLFLETNSNSLNNWWKLEYVTDNKSQQLLYSLPIAPFQYTNRIIEQWTHLALTFHSKHKDNAILSFYINGILLEQHKIPNLFSYSNETTTTILGRDDTSSSLNGYLSTMIVWENHVLSAKDIRYVHQHVKRPNDHSFTYSECPSLPNPTYVYPFHDAAHKMQNYPQFFASMELESSFLLAEYMNNNASGVFYRNVPLPLPTTVGGGYRYLEYKDGTYTPSIKNYTQLKMDSDVLARKRRVHVRNAMKHAWKGYKTYAWGSDELKPQSKQGQNNWGAQATTMVDALSTLWIMGMQDEFYEGRDYVRDNLTYDTVGEVSVFETTIRNLGGLLSAYDLSNDLVFLEKADDLGSRLLRSIGPSGIPFGRTVLNHEDGKSYNQGWLGNNAVLAELGTIQLEFRYLAAATGKNEYATIVNRILPIIRKINPEDGLYSIYIQSSNDDSKPRFGCERISFGAMGDSFYEYMLKVWIQGGRRETNLRNMYDRAMDGLHKKLIHKSNPNGLTYIAELNGESVERKMDHLACFMGGLLALGAYTSPHGLNSKNAQRDLLTAKAVTYTCYQMYAKTKTGLSSEFVSFQNSDVDFVAGSSAPFYILRPEVVESLYILHFLTGDPIYREWSWEIFLSIERFCRTSVAYGSLPNVDQTHLLPEDRMESFFLAETLKYLYLIQDPDSTIDILNTHVFNTEAHPLKLINDIKKIKNRKY